MELKDLVAVSGLPGLYKLVTTRSNGLVIADLDSGKTRFCSLRKHQFTPLETVGIYTHMDTTELKEVFKAMISNPPPDKKIQNSEYFKYFEEVLPDFDRDKVYLSDIKKIIKWYEFLKQREMLTGGKDEEE